MNKLWYIHSLEYNTAIKMHELELCKTWMNLNNILLNKERKSEKNSDFTYKNLKTVKRKQCII